MKSTKSPEPSEAPEVQPKDTPKPASAFASAAARLPALRPKTPASRWIALLAVAAVLAGGGFIAGVTYARAHGAAGPRTGTGRRFSGSGMYGGRHSFRSLDGQSSPGQSGPSSGGSSSVNGQALTN